VTAPSVLLVARFGDDEHPHSRQRVRALERLGCDVTPFDLDRRPGLLGRLTGADLETRLRRAVAEAEATLVLAIGAYDVDEATVVLLRSATGVPWVQWFPDDLTRAEDMARVAGGYDRVFVTGSDVAAELERRTGRAPELLPHAADPSVYRPMNSKDQYRANVVFAGAATPAREAYLAMLVEFGLALWGPGWRRTSLRDYCRGEARDTAEYVRAYGGASVAVNLHRDLAAVVAGDRAACNQRTFELAAIGVPQVVDDRADLPRWFEPGRQVLTFRSPEELKAAVEALLHDPPAAESVGAAARAEALARHTHMHRLRDLLAAVGAAAGQPADRAG
jgi:spore maturation protein CgeB